MKTNADEATRENLPEVPSVFGGLFGTNPMTREYLESLKQAQEFLEAFEAKQLQLLRAKPINGWCQ